MRAIEINLNPDRRVLRQFGFIALAVFAALGAIALWRGHVLGLALESWAGPVAFTFWIVAGVSGLLSLVRPEGNRLLYLALCVIAYPIGYVMSYVLMGAIFFGLLTPVNLVFRLIGRDALGRTFDRRGESYWVPRAGPPPVGRYFRQF
jgi:Saxitoxin biosynthesis operon protein SxtJ